MIFYNFLTATDFTAPAVPQEAEAYFPSEINTFSEGLIYVLKKGFAYVNPDITEAAKICMGLICVAILISLLNTIRQENHQINNLIGAVATALVLIKPSDTLIHLGIDTVEKISDYGKLMLPVMTGALAAEGGITTSAGLYTATMVVNTALMSILANLLIPLMYCYIVVGIASNVIDNTMLQDIGKLIKWLSTWILKGVIYIFTGYLSVTGVVNGSVDASTLKATKLAVTGVVPVVGNIISDASETILISASLMKNTAGIYGMLAILAIWIGPFLQIGIHYLFLKLTAALCAAFCDTKACKLVKNFSDVMGILLAATGTMCILHLISTFCFMRGTGR